MKRKILVVIVCLLIFTVSGCSSVKNKEMNYTAESDYEIPREETVGYESTNEYTDTASESEENTSAANVKNSGRKRITTVNLSIETLEFDQLTKLLEQKITEAGGYVEASSSENSSYRYDRVKNASYTFRIPSEKLDDFVTMVGENANIIEKKSETDDVTLSYYDSESRKKALEIQQERLLNLLEKAEKIEDIIELESRLSEVTYELEAQGSVLRNYDNLVEYSTIHVSVYEVERERKVVKESTSQKMKQGLSDTMYEIKEGIEAFTVSVVTNLPYIIFWGIVIVVIVFIIKSKIRSKKRIINTSKESNSSSEGGDKQ